MARILIVDDCQDERELAADALSADGHITAQADNIWISNTIDRFDPDIVLMDVGMGKQKGNVATAALKRSRFGDGLIVVLYSSHDRRTLAQLAEECGADAFVDKSSVTELLDVVRQLTEKRPDGPPNRSID